MSKTKLKTIRGPIEPFAVPVTAINLHGQEVEFIFQGKPRSRTEWAPLQKELMAEQLHDIRKQAEDARATEAAQEASRVAAAEPAEGGGTSWAGIIDAVDHFDAVDVSQTTNDANRRQAEIALMVAQGWDLDDAFELDALMELEDKFPGVVQTLVREYGKAIHGAREKNSVTLPSRSSGSSPTATASAT